MDSIISILRNHGIPVTPQRIAIAEIVLRSQAHPSAEDVWTAVKKKHPTLSRATVYNTLNLLVSKRLLRAHVLHEGITVFDPYVDRHHHFIDESTGEIQDIEWDAIQVNGADSLSGFEVHEYQVVMRGRKKKR